MGWIDRLPDKEELSRQYHPGIPAVFVGVSHHIRIAVVLLFVYYFIVECSSSIFISRGGIDLVFGREVALCLVIEVESLGVESHHLTPVCLSCLLVPFFMTLPLWELMAT